ncbi:MAG: tRNA pseudouridine(38-40) synthase TruA [Candidatus Hadarchaeota archaeon]
MLHEITVVMKFALLFAYDGSRYFGFARQPGKATVESEVLKALRGCGVFSSLTEAGYRAASRTDKGVSATGQVISLKTTSKPDISLVNTGLPEDISILAAEEVEPDFDARKMAVEKRYRYLCDAPPNFSLGTAQKAVKMFCGRHDFFNFCKREPGKPTEMKLIVTIKSGKPLRLDFHGDRFLLQQVRRITQAILQAGRGDISLEVIEAMLNRMVDRSLQPAPPEGLFLLGVEYTGLKFKPDVEAVERFESYLGKKGAPIHKEMAVALRGLRRS